MFVLGFRDSPVDTDAKFNLSKFWLLHANEVDRIKVHFFQIDTINIMRQNNGIQYKKLQLQFCKRECLFSPNGLFLLYMYTIVEQTTIKVDLILPLISFIVSVR